jgi:hypothetical protein
MLGEALDGVGGLALGDPADVRAMRDSATHADALAVLEAFALGLQRGGHDLGLWNSF